MRIEFSVSLDVNEEAYAQHYCMPVEKVADHVRQDVQKSAWMHYDNLDLIANPDA